MNSAADSAPVASVLPQYSVPEEMKAENVQVLGTVMPVIVRVVESGGDGDAAATAAPNHSQKRPFTPTWRQWKKSSPEDIFPRQLIRAVRARPEIWNRTLHKTKNCCKYWQEISAETGKSAKFCKQKWKNLIDTFRANLRKAEERPEDFEGRPSRWKYHNQMLFVKRFLVTKPHTLQALELTEEESNLIDTEEMHLDAQEQQNGEHRNAEDVSRPNQLTGNDGGKTGKWTAMGLPQHSDRLRDDQPSNNTQYILEKQWPSESKVLSTSFFQIHKKQPPQPVQAPEAARKSDQRVNSFLGYLDCLVKQIPAGSKRRKFESQAIELANFYIDGYEPAIVVQNYE